jgi:hypothetical protein
MSRLHGLATSLLLAVSACGSVSGVPVDAGADTGSGSGNTDAAIDAAIDAPIDALPPKMCSATTCTNNTLEVCGGNGMVEHVEQCTLGCFTDNTRCNAVAPSNGLASQLDMGAQQSDVTLPSGTTINTDNGTVTTPNGTVAIATNLVTQSGGPTLRVLIAKSFTLGNVRVSGTLPLALVAPGEIKLTGVLDASADAATIGPGALACAGTGAGGAPGAGLWARPPAGNSGGYPGYLWNVNGSGGGGFGTAGGVGGERTDTSVVGAAGIVNGVATLIPLRGGCPGHSDNATYRGAGGGAVQLVSNKRVHLVDSGASKGMINVGGGGGHAGDLGRDDVSSGPTVYGAAGGGSGGAVLIEAPILTLDAGTALLATGGGGGGYGACSPIANGLDAPASGSTPTGGACPAAVTPKSTGGNGATTSSGGAGSTNTHGSAGGGGGGLGRIRINTADGQYTSTGALVRGNASTAMVGRR